MVKVFCYGSNLDPRQLLERCPGARFVGTATLRDHRVDFVGWSHRWRGAVATIRRARGQQVHGVVVELDIADLVRLDAFEGAPNWYRRLSVSPVGADGERVGACSAYVARDEVCAEGAAPSPQYVLRILAGHRFWGFPPAAARTLVRDSGIDLAPRGRAANA